MEYMKLGDIVNIRTGKLNANVADEKGSYPFFTCSKKISSISSYSYDTEAVLVAGNGDLNVKYYKGKFDAYQRTYIITDNSSNQLYMPFLYFYMSAYVAQLRNQAIGGVIKYIKLQNLTEAEIRLPSIEQQKEIVKFLQIIQGVINDKKNEMSKLDELIKARFVEMFGDPISNNKSLSLKEFREICDLKAGDFTPAKQIFKVQDPINQYPCYGGNGIRGFVSNYTHDGKYVLIGRQGALCGNVKLASGKFKNTEHAILVNPKIPINVFWLFELLDLEKLNRFKSGAAQPGLAVKTLNKILIPNVDLECQNEFANFVQQVDKSKFENIVYLNKTLSMKILGQLGDVFRD